MRSVIPLILCLGFAIGLAGCKTPPWSREAPAPVSHEEADSPTTEDAVEEADSPDAETEHPPDSEPTPDEPDAPVPFPEDEDPQVPELPEAVDPEPQEVIDGKTVFGWVEWICLEPEGIQMKAKLDSGALTSSMNAMNLRRFERDGERWVSFEIIDPATEKRVRLERPISRNVRIVRHEDEPDRRPVVELEVRMGDVFQKAEFSLVDRSNFVYQVLIGRRFLRGYGLIDSERTFLSGRPPCAGDSGGIDPEDLMSDEDALDDGR